MKTITDYDYRFKVVIVGSFGVGKSSIVNRLVEQTYSEDMMSTIGVDVKFKNYLINGKRVRLQIWDTAGQEVFRTIVSAYYRGADAIIAVHDLTQPHTFDDIVQFWSKEIENNKGNRCKTMVLASKSDECDLAHPLSGDQIQDIKLLMGTELYFETSAKQEGSVQKAFMELVTRMLEQKRISQTVSAGNAIKLKQKEPKSLKERCCFE